MEELAILLLLLLIVWLVVAPIMAIVKAGSAAREAKETKDQLRTLRDRLADLERTMAGIKRGTVEPASEPPEKPVAVAHETESALARVLAEREKWMESFVEAPLPPPLPMPVVIEETVDFPADEVEAPPPLPPQTKAPFSLEQFMGVKLFAWLGGVAMFFGVIYFVKYAFENNWIPPAVRIALGFVAGAGLLVGGLVVHRLPRYRVLAQVFCATGVLVLYGVSFAAHAVYHFAAFGPVSTFVLMGLITLVAFLVAVRLDALVVAVLGMLGGFITPVLLSTGHDNVLGLFGYIALLDIGLLAVSRQGKWRFLIAAAALGTALMQIGWYAKFFVVGQYFDGAKTLIPMGVLTFFILLFLAGGWVGHAKSKMDEYSAAAVTGLAAVAMGFAFAMLGFQPVAERYFLLYGFLFTVNLAVIAMVMKRPQVGGAQVLFASFTFFHLAFWTMGRLTSGNLIGALILYLVFGALHSVLPVILARRWPENPALVPLKVGPWFAPLALVLMLMPVLHLSPVPLIVWAAILLVDLLVIGLALATGRVLPVLASLALTMGVAAMWLFRVPVKVDSLMPFLGVITGFSAVFAFAGRLFHPEGPPEGEPKSPEKVAAAILPVCSGVLPFALLVLALLQLPVANPSPVFGVALLMTVLLAGIALIGKQGPLVIAALIATLAVEGVWHAQHFRADSPMLALGWYLGFYGLFLAFPFVFRKACSTQAGPWIASALSGVGHFLLVHDLVKHAFPNRMMGLVPAAFAVPSLIALVAVIRAFPTMDERNRSQMAWFGGVALFFITLVFPIQFDRQWITVSWALEGALLLWLFRRVPHPGLQITGLALLVVSFVRLALNPAVFTDYLRSGTAILNWHLYAFGSVAAAQFAGAFWFTDPTDRLKQLHPRGVLHALGGVLLFILLNVEIADFFTAPGDRCVAFRFGGNFARDMTYSIAWGLFSLGLLGIGIWNGSKHTRFAAIGLLVITLIKVFLHDLAVIDNIFRIGALVGVAVIAFIASFLYQRFFDRSGHS
jgi:uncharacterized membrane protein